MITREENELLSRVGPGTPGGQLLRRYWHVVAAAEITAAKPKKRLRLLGEDLLMRFLYCERPTPSRSASPDYSCFEEPL